MDNCIFCKIVAREIPAEIISETDDIIVFMSLEKHPLVVPKKHIPDIFSLDDATGALIMKEAIKTSKAVKSNLQCDGIYITQANGAAAGQEVFHYHLHVYPRWNDKREEKLH